MKDDVDIGFTTPSIHDEFLAKTHQNSLMGPPIRQIPESRTTTEVFPCSEEKSITVKSVPEQESATSADENAKVEESVVPEIQFPQSEEQNVKDPKTKVLPSTMRGCKELPSSSALDSASVMSKFATSPPARNLDMSPVLDDAYDATARDAMLNTMPDDTMLDTARDTMSDTALPDIARDAMPDTARDAMPNDAMLDTARDTTLPDVPLGVFLDAHIARVTANARDASESADTIEIEPAFAPARSSSPRYELPDIPEGYVMEGEIAEDFLALVASFGSSAVILDSRSYREVLSSPPAPHGPPSPAAPRPAPASSAIVPLRSTVPATRLGPHSEVHRASGGPVLDADGFQQPRKRNRHPRVRRAATPPSQRRRRSPSPEEVAGLCFRCLEGGHRVRACTNPVRCCRCLISGHESNCCETRLPSDHPAQPQAVHRQVPNSPLRNLPPRLHRDAA
ncbi:hypothetical protein ZWY2020_049539 [Hordeum vulgare]|nr:hypothetical protein ZWY2020_049539 [Hordeum vulgare]